MGYRSLIQTTYFAPKGLFGYLYWYTLFVLHKRILDAIFNRVVTFAESESSEMLNGSDV